jgi:hypothetical protein
MSTRRSVSSSPVCQFEIDTRIALRRRTPGSGEHPAAPPARRPSPRDRGRGSARRQDRSRAPSVPVTNPIEASAGRPSRSTIHPRVTCSTIDADGPATYRPAFWSSHAEASQSAARVAGNAPPIIPKDQEVVDEFWSQADGPDSIPRAVRNSVCCDRRLAVVLRLRPPPARAPASAGCGCQTDRGTTSRCRTGGPPARRRTRRRGS